MYRLNVEQRKIAATAAATAERELAPRAAAVDRDAAFPKDSIAALGANGLLGLTVPKAHGGLGQGPRTAAAVRVVAGVDDVRLGVHVCRGNWSRDETTLLSGGYQALRTSLDRLQITQLVLEYATERAGTLVRFEGKELGLGVVNPRTDEVETPEQIRAAVEAALRLYPAERVFLNPDCGFGTFSNRPMNTLEIASAKVAAMAAAARDLRGRS